MVSIKTLLVAVTAASVQASPVAHGTSPTTHGISGVPVPDESSLGGWTIPEGAVDITGNWELINKIKKQEGIEITTNDFVVDPTADTSPNPAKAGEVSVMGGPCNQGHCPDYDRAFDMMYTWSQTTSPGSGGAPPTTIVWNDFQVRVNDCGKCYIHRVGSTHGGCYDFTACNRKQQICVDDGKNRAHRIWKDNNHKTCYRIEQIGLGGCGIVKARVIFRPAGEIACNW